MRKVLIDIFVLGLPVGLAIIVASAHPTNFWILLGILVMTPFYTIGVNRSIR